EAQSGRQGRGGSVRSLPDRPVGEPDHGQGKRRHCVVPAVMLRFDAESHTYHLGDKRIPNVTSILEPLVDYAKVPKDILQAAKQRGDYVHKCCEMYLWGT